MVEKFQAKVPLNWLSEMLRCRRPESLVMIGGNSPERLFPATERYLRLLSSAIAGEMKPETFELDILSSTTKRLVSSHLTPTHEQRAAWFDMFQLWSTWSEVYKDCLRETKMDACFLRDKLGELVGEAEEGEKRKRRRRREERKRAMVSFVGEKSG